MKNHHSSSLTGKPQPSFTLFCSMAVIVGIVVGSGIFRLPSIVASQSANEWQFLLFWAAGGFISLMGALCYAGLASCMPDTGGEYFFLKETFGPAAGFLLAWGRMTVIQTGSIALIAFIIGDYAAILLDLGAHSTSIYALFVVVLLTGLNLAGTKPSRHAQNILASIVVVMLAVLVFSALKSISGTSIRLSSHGGSLFSGGAAGPAMILVLLTYGGWSEAAYLSGELQDKKRGMLKALVYGILIITILYILINFSYLQVLGFESLKNSDTVGYDLAAEIFGPSYSLIVVIIIIISSLSTANATILTGARTNYAIGRDFKFLGFLGKWNDARNTPVKAHVFQGFIALSLVIAGSFSKHAIQTMVDYTAPVFWFFLTLITIGLFIFRFKNNPEKRCRVPLYPLPPVLFLIACIYMFYASLVFTGTGAWISVLIVLTGIPVYLLSRRKGE